MRWCNLFLILTLLCLFIQLLTWTPVWSTNNCFSSRLWLSRWSVVSLRPRLPSSTARCSCCLATWPPGLVRMWCVPLLMSPVGSGGPPSSSTSMAKMAWSTLGASSPIPASHRPSSYLWSSRQKVTAGHHSRTSSMPTKFWSWDQSTGWSRGSSTPLPVLLFMTSTRGEDEMLNHYPCVVLIISYT